MRRALLAVILKELRQTFRDRRMTAILVMAPIIQLTLLGYAVDLDVDHIATAICDRDHTPTSRRLVEGLTADGTLLRSAYTGHPERPLEQGSAQVVVVLPRGLERDLKRGRPVQVQVLVDGSDPIKAMVAESAATQFFFREGLRAAAEQLTRAALAGRHISRPTIAIQPRVLYNPRMKSPLYMIPGVVVIVLLLITTIVTAMGIAREKEMGTIEQLLITPIRPSVLLLGKMLPFAMIGVVVAGMALAVGTHLFGVPIRGSLDVILVGTILYLMSTLGAGVLISTLARTQQQAMLGGMFFILPAILLSGFATPIETMPDWIVPLTWINPLRYYVTILRAALLKGAGYADLWQPMAALLAFGVVILAVAALRFRRQLA